MADVTLTITIPEAVVTRVRTAYQRLLGTPGLPTQADIENAIRANMRAAVRRAETLEAQESVAEPPDFT